jgi:hypothetical protein
MAELNELSKNIDLSDKEAVSDIVDKVKKESEEALAALDGLEEEISDLEKNPDMEINGGALKDLEDRFNKRYKALREENDGSEAQV